GMREAGGDLNYVAKNRVSGSPTYGILVLGNPSVNTWLASGNEVRHNHVSGSGIADLALGAPSGASNCFSDNQASTTAPPLLEVTHPCDTPLSLNGGGELSDPPRPPRAPIHHTRPPLRRPHSP